jgi:hypothetical protein
MKVSAAILVPLILSAGCGPSSPSIQGDFPLFYLMDVDTGEPSMVCCFLGAQGDALAAAGTRLLFLDRDVGFVKADVNLSSPIAHAASSPEGGYGLAVSGPLLHIVSNETYIQRQPLPLPAPGAFILPKPQSTLLVILCSDGTAVKVSTSNWEITAQGQTGANNPGAAAMSSDGRYVFAGNAQGRVYRISTVDLSSEMTFQAPGAVTDFFPLPGQEMLMTVEGVSQVWAVDVNTGLHTESYDITAPAVAVCATGDGRFIYASVPGQGIVIVDILDNTIVTQSNAFGSPADMAVNGNSTRAVISCPDMLKVFMLQR